MEKKFRTEIQLTESEFKISHSDKILFTGSCFTENIGAKLQYYGFHSHINPFGILYNPVSVKKSIQLLVDKKEFTKKDLFQNEGMWHSFYHHSRFSSNEINESLFKINQEITQAHSFLKKNTYLFVTFGTARVYRLVKNDEIVSNCHKLPPKLFTNELLSVDTLYNEWIEVIEVLKNFNPHIKIIFTVSPVRHWKDGATGNQLSKATLLLFIHRLIKDYQHLSYFPSFELLIDDLRDYRFYQNDMLHPSAFAVDYIWEKFIKHYFSEETKALVNEIGKIRRMFEHRAFNIKTEAYKKFITKRNQAFTDFTKKNPMINLQLS